MTPVANCRRYQRHRRQICHRYQRHRRQILPPVSLVLLTPVANLPPVSTIPAANLRPVSTTPVANYHRYQRHRRQICRRCRWHQWQILEQYQAADTLKWSWRQKCIYMLTLLPKGAETKLLKFFCLKIFSICRRCRWHQWCTLSREYLRKFSKKFEMAVMVYSDAWGKLIHEKNQKWHCPFKAVITSRRNYVTTLFGIQRVSYQKVWEQKKLSLLQRYLSFLTNLYIYLLKSMTWGLSPSFTLPPLPSYSICRNPLQLES